MLSVYQRTIELPAVITTVALAYSVNASGHLGPKEAVTGYMVERVNTTFSFAKADKISEKTE